MDKPSKLNERLTLIANIAVVLGIVFLAMELRQNTNMMQAQIRDSMTEKEMEYLLAIATVPELADVWQRGRDDGTDQLSLSERSMFAALAQSMFREWENSYYQYRQGLFSREEFEARLGSWREVMAQPSHRGVWERFRESFSSDFRAEVDSIVAEIEGQ